MVRCQGSISHRPSITIYCYLKECAHDNLKSGKTKPGKEDGTEFVSEAPGNLTKERAQVSRKDRQTETERECSELPRDGESEILG